MALRATEGDEDAAGAAGRCPPERTLPVRYRAATARERCLRYFVTFACYGAHGDESGSVDAKPLMAERRETALNRRWVRSLAVAAR